MKNPACDPDRISAAYERAKSVYAAYGVDCDAIIAEFDRYTMSLHCWQGDDVKGFEGIAAFSQNVVTGCYPGASRNGDELREDIDRAFAFSPLSHRVNLHSMYAEPSSPRERSELTFEDFSKWAEWAKEKGYGVDFNVSFFTHPMMKNDLSLSSPDRQVRDYWVRAGIGGREISAQIGKALGTPCINNIWIPDGLKDLPADRMAFRDRLIDSLDRILDKKYDRSEMADVLEGKLFGIGTESFVVGSHEFYLGYAAATKKAGVTIDTGHYHPSENIPDKLTSICRFVDPVLLHISRGIRWDSDHVLIQSDELTSLMKELRRAGLLGKINMGLDYFDGSINRVAAWAIGLRAAAKALLTAMLEPWQLLKKAEDDWDFTSRLALLDEFANLPVNAVWDMLLLKKNITVGTAWIDELKQYEEKVQLKR